MPKIYYAAVLILTLGLPAWGQTNLLGSAGFEEIPPVSAKDHLAGGWWLYQGTGETELRRDTGAAHSGTAAARLHASTNAKSVLASAPFAVSPEDELDFSVWVKGADLPQNARGTYAGLAFRRADGTVFGRQYFGSGPLGEGWQKISGQAVTPAEAVSGEVHLGYTNAPGVLWFDDASAIIKNPLSLALVSEPKPWPGSQDLRVRIVNRGVTQFVGAVSARLGKTGTPVRAEVPPGATSEFAVPVSAATPGLHPYALELVDARGAELRRIEGRFRVNPPLTLFPACPCYQVAGASDGETRIDARINLSPEARQGLKLTVEASGAALSQPLSASADASAAEMAGLTLRLPAASPGVFTITARLLAPTGSELAQATTDVHIVPAAESRVLTGPDGYLRVEGKPFFPLGIYNCGRYPELGEAGFNATHNYGIVTGEAEEAINSRDGDLKQMLDQAAAAGLRMMVELPRKAIEKAKWEQVRRRVETFKHHPGLLCWGSEERVARGAAPLKNVLEMYRLVHELDPDHPLVLGDTKAVITKLQGDRSDFFPDEAMDAGIWWWYPFPLKEPDANGVDAAVPQPGVLQNPSWLVSTHSHKPLWIAIQAYQKPSRDAEFPTPEDYRCQSYLSIIHGVRGLWFYVGYGQKDYQGKPAGLLNKPEEAHWGYVKQLAAELKALTPVITAPVGKRPVQVQPGEGLIDFATREIDGKTYLLAANRSAKEQSAQFACPDFKGKRVTVLYEKHSALLEGDTLKDTFGAFGVHVYRFD